jgi:uncharacterized membrane protein YraQ (UPF0718 family)
VVCLVENHHDGRTQVRVANAVIVILTLVLALTAYLQGGNRHITGITEGAKMILPILPMFLCAFLIAGYLRVLLPESVVQGWLGKESGFRGLVVGYMAGILTFGGPFVSIPIAASLYQVGASVQTVTVYVTSWALWGGGIIFYEVSILGPRLFAIRILVSLFFPLIAGLLAGLLDRTI